MLINKAIFMFSLAFILSMRCLLLSLISPRHRSKKRSSLCLGSGEGPWTMDVGGRRGGIGWARSPSKAEFQALALGTHGARTSWREQVAGADLGNHLVQDSILHQSGPPVQLACRPCRLALSLLSLVVRSWLGRVL